MQLSLQAIQLPFDNNHNMRWLYVNRILRDITNRATLFFFPIFLFVVGQSLNLPWNIPDWSKGILLVAVYHLLLRILMIFLLLPLNQITKKLAPNKTIVMGYGMRAVFFALLSLSIQNPAFLLVAVVIEAIEMSLFWPHFHLMLTKSGHKSKMGSNVGSLQFLMQVLGVLAPIIAVSVNNFAGYSAVFLLGVIGSLLGLISTLKLKSSVERDQVSWKEFLIWVKEPRYKRYLLAIGGRMANDLVMYLWPLYLFILLGSVDKVGYLAALSFFLALFITVIASFQLDKIRNARIFHFTGGIMSLLWVARAAAITPMVIAVIDSVDKLVGNAHWLFYDMLIFKRAKGGQAFSFFVYQEIIYCGWAILFWCLMTLILILTQNWVIVFLIGSMGVLMTLLLQGKHGEPAG